MYSRTIEPEIDQYIKSQYHAICFNPAKKQDLLRMTQNLDSFQQNSLALIDDGNLDNELIQKYIKSIYEKYNIQDPIQKQFRLANCSQRLSELHIRSSINTKKQMQLANTRTSTARNKIMRLKQSFKSSNTRQMSYTSPYRQLCDSQHPKQSIQIREFQLKHVPKGIGYKTKQKIKFKHNISRQEIISNQIHPSKIKRLSPLNLNCQIPTIFRFCPICEQSILQVNIQWHQQKCEKLRKAYDLPIQQLKLLIQQKILRIQNEIKAQMQISSQQTLNNHQQLKKSIATWLKQQNNQNYQILQQNFKKSICSQYENINKLKWFRKMLKNMEQRIVSYFQ